MFKTMNAFILATATAAVVPAQQQQQQQRQQQQQPQQQQQVFFGEERVNNITIDLQVRDAEGVPVFGLKRDDFRVFENDAPQRLTNFLAVRAGEVGEAGDAGLVGQPAPRQMLLFFDLYLMTEPEKRQVLRGLLEQVSAGLPPAMTVAVVSFDGTLRVHTPPTESRERVLAALKEVERISATGLQRQIKLSSYDQRGQPYRETWGRYELRRTQNEEYWSEMRMMVGRVEAAFTAAVQRFAATPARKVVILASPGFPRASNVPEYREYDFFLNKPPEYRNLGLLGQAATLASEMEYTLFTLDVSGYQVADADASERLPAPDFTDVANAKFWRESDRKDTLIQAARLTGGEPLFTRDAGAALADVERVTASYYSLGIQPDHYGDGKTYELRVEVAGHPEYQLTYRTRYVDRPFDEREAERTRAGLLTGESANPLGIELALDKPTSKFKVGARGLRAYRVPAELRIPYANLVMIPRGAASFGQVQVVIVATDPDGSQSALTHQKLPIEIASEKLEEARQRGFYSFTFTLELEGGAHSVRIGVNDTLARTTSTVIADLKL
jgi:VWFA-related protein